jgi:hypothetical protein
VAVSVFQIAADKEIIVDVFVSPSSMQAISYAGQNRPTLSMSLYPVSLRRELLEKRLQ